MCSVGRHLPKRGADEHELHGSRRGKRRLHRGKVQPYGSVPPGGVKFAESCETVGRCVMALHERSGEREVAALGGLYLQFALDCGNSWPSAARDAWFAVHLYLDSDVPASHWDFLKSCVTCLQNGTRSAAVIPLGRGLKILERISCDSFVG